MRHIATPFGERLLASDATEQSGPYMNGVWRTVLRALPSSFSPQTILVLGVGLGGNLPLLHKRFPQAQITAVEWDEHLLTKTQERHKFLRPWVEYHCGDAAKWIHDSSDRFDLVIVDLFTGKDVASCVRDDHFISALVQKTKAIVCINVYTHQDVLEKYDNAFSSVHRQARYYQTLVGMYERPLVAS